MVIIRGTGVLLLYLFCNKSHYENVPFEIPGSWCWTTLGEVFTLQAGKNITAKEISDKQDTIYPFPCYGGNGLRGYVSSYNRTGRFPLIGRQGALCGNINVADGLFYATEHAVVVESYCNIDVDWAVYALIYLNLNQYATSTAQPGLSVATINEVLLPVPPIDEQKRIANEIEKWFDLIKEIESGMVELKSYIKQATSKILDLAITGKLVPQDPNDEPAIELLKRINPGFKPCDNSHYENLPQGWVKLRLGDVCSFERGITFPSSAKCTIKQPGMIACIRTANVQDNLELDDLWYVGNEYIKGNTEKLVRKNDIIMSSANSRELVGKVSYVHDISEQTTFGGFVLNIRAKEGVLPFYLFLMLKNLYLKGYHLTIATQTTNIANLNTKILSNIEVLLPPLTEQKRIINSVTNILANIENITAELS